MLLSSFLPEPSANLIRVKKIKLAKNEAVLEAVGEGVEFDVPLELLPKNVKENETFTLEFLPAAEQNTETVQRQMLQALIS